VQLLHHEARYGEAGSQAERMLQAASLPKLSSLGSLAKISDTRDDERSRLEDLLKCLYCIRLQLADRAKTRECRGPDAPAMTESQTVPRPSSLSLSPSLFLSFCV